MTSRRAYVLRLALVSAAVIAGVWLWTLDAGRQLAVERRIPALAELADAHDVPVGPLIALCVAEAQRIEARSDVSLARALAEALAGGDDVGAAMAALIEDPVERRMTMDLLARNEGRWRRLQAAGR